MPHDQLAATFRSGKFHLKMSSYSFELLISFLQENNLMLMLKLINQYLDIEGFFFFFFFFLFFFFFFFFS